MKYRVRAAAVLAATVLLATAGQARSHRHEDETPPPPPPVELISFTPAPGVSFGIPPQFIACEDDTEKMLSSARDSLNLKDKFCTRSSNVPSKLRAFDPRPLHTLTVIFNYHAHQPISEQALQDMAPDDLAKVHDAICGVVTKPLNQSGGTADSCDVTLGSLAGHRALVSAVVESSPTDSKYKYLILSYEVSYPQGYMQIQFGRVDIVDSIVKPEMDAIIASIQISSAAAPPPVPGEAPHDGQPTTPPADNPALRQPSSIGSSI